MPEWYESDSADLLDGLILCENEIRGRYEAGRRMGRNLYEGYHWDATALKAIQKQLGDGIQELPVRNVYRQKVRNEAFLLTPGLPSLQFQIKSPPGEEVSEADVVGTQYLLDEGWKEILVRSEYEYEGQRAIVDFENQNLAWFVLLPFDQPKQLEIRHIPTGRMLFDPGLSRIRDMKWFAFVDLISYEQAHTLYPDKIDRNIEQKRMGENFRSLDHIKKQKDTGDSLLQIIHVYALKGATVPVAKVHGKEGQYRTFDKAVHLVYIEKVLVHEGKEFPKNRKGDALLPCTHVILEGDPDDITGKGLAETAFEAQKLLNDSELAITAGFAENWMTRKGIRGGDQTVVDALNNGEKYIAMGPRAEIIPITGSVITQDQIAAVQMREHSFETLTGNFASIEGGKVSGIPSAAGQIHLTQQARTPINARARMLGMSIKRLGEIYLGWIRVWETGGLTQKWLNSIDIEVELDSLNEFSKNESFQTLIGLAQAGYPVGDMLIEKAALNSGDRQRLLRATAEQRKLQEQAMQEAKQQMMAQNGGGAPGMPAEAGLPPGVQTIMKGIGGAGT